MNIDKKKFKDNIAEQLKLNFSITLEEANKRQLFDAVSYAIMELIHENWIKTRQTYDKKDVKQAYYLSAEFLMGRAMGNNLVNMSILKDVKEVLDEIGFNYNEIEEQEYDAGLGNGGLGRLAACFLDSLATLGLPGHGYGLRYRYGMFEQKIIDGHQVETPDKWLRYGDPWSVCRQDEAVEVKFGGYVEVESDDSGRHHFRRITDEIIIAIPYDMPIVGYGNNTVNTLRLWQAESPEDFDLQLFNEGLYLKAIEKSNVAKNISRVLYPNDHTNPGKELRLRQQYFFVSASLQDVVNKFKEKHGTDFSKLPDYACFQLNDTHPVVAIPELMRIFLDKEKLEWEKAWDITVKTCAFTNHTLMSEAFEKWPVDLFTRLLPRIYQITEEINRRFMDKLRKKYPGDWERHQRMAIIRDGIINMAWLGIEGTFRVNGVAQLHTDLLRNFVVKDWDELYPGKIINKTNGVTQRRWLLKSNPALADLITRSIGDGWITNLDELKKLEPFADDPAFVKEFMKIKTENKKVLADYIKKNNNIVVDVNSIFDVQIKRLHEYKRQLLNLMHIMYQYNLIKENPKAKIVPRTYIFGAKAASGYHRAKLIIKFINNVAEKINADPEVSDKIKVVFLANYRVSLAEKIFPASDVSEQISTAGKEASGTGNMKFMMNGAVTIGTLDGANVEIVEKVGNDNAFIFGLTAEQVAELKLHNSYTPREIYDGNPGLRKVINQFIDGTFSEPYEKDIFRELYDALMYGVDGNSADEYFLIADFEAYVKAQEKVEKTYRDKEKWAKTAIINVANSGKFSSDRTIAEYAKEIWNIKKVKV
jgi:starch phosphorylase